MNRAGLFIETAETLEARGGESSERRTFPGPQHRDAQCLLRGQRTGVRHDNSAARLLPTPRLQPPAKRGRGKVVERRPGIKYAVLPGQEIIKRYR
jgi:hypothetical protein